MTLTLEEAIAREEEIVADNERFCKVAPSESAEAYHSATYHRQIVEWLKEVQERKTGKWIPVTERLPEEKLAVLVWCPQRSNIYCAYHDKRNVNKVVYSEWFIFGAFDTLVNEDVVAWMPLPEPYKEVDE